MVKKLCLPKEYIVSAKCGKPAFSLAKWLNTKPKDRCTELEKFKFDCKNPIKPSPCDCKDDCDTFSFNDWLDAYREDPTSVDPIYFPEDWFVDENCSRLCCSFLIDPCDNLEKEILLPKKHYKQDCCSISFVTNCLEEIAAEEAISIGCVEGDNMLYNGSFEEYSVCPNNQQQVSRAVGWEQIGEGSSDYWNHCDDTIPSVFINTTLLDYPGGDGIMGFYVGIRDKVCGVGCEYHENIGQILNSPLLAGVQYKMTFSIAGVYTASPQCDDATHPPADIVLYGNTDATNPIGISSGGFGCVTDIDPSWVVLGTFTYTPEKVWSSESITFTPTEDIEVIAIGGGCNVPLEYGSSDCDPYILLDCVRIWAV